MQFINLVDRLINSMPIIKINNAILRVRTRTQNKQLNKKKNKFRKSKLSYTARTDTGSPGE
jgi:hypothetical protein